jgi:hypothetical protein
MRRNQKIYEAFGGEVAQLPSLREWEKQAQSIPRRVMEGVVTSTLFSLLFFSALRKIIRLQWRVRSRVDGVPGVSGACVGQLVVVSVDYFFFLFYCFPLSSVMRRLRIAFSADP